MAVLSPLLERLVLQGKAKVKTTVVGQSGHAVMAVARDTLAIIVEFDYQNFIDFENPGDQEEFFRNSVHQLQFRSKKSANHFIIRSPIKDLLSAAPPVLTTEGYYRKETFLIHQGIIEVNIIRVPSTAGSLSVPGPAPQATGTQQPPLGYGSTAAAILTTIGYSDGLGLSEYVPLTEEFTPFSAGNPFNFSQFLVPFDFANALLPTFSGSEEGNWSYPIVNITYVEILRSLADKVFSSS